MITSGNGPSPTGRTTYAVVGSVTGIAHTSSWIARRAGRSSGRDGQHKNDDRADDEDTQQISKHDVHPGFAEAGRGRLT